MWRAKGLTTGGNIIGGAAAKALVNHDYADVTDVTIPRPKLLVLRLGERQ